MPTDDWAVTVWRNGEKVVTIAINSLAGRDIDAADEEAIRTCARQLLAFVGDREADDGGRS